jgi:hypothetical protein
MAPEQAASERVGPEADWYSVGVLLYEALTGRLPHSGSAYKVIMDKQRVVPASPATCRPGVPPDLDALCMDLLAFEPGARPSGAEVLRRLGVESPVTSASQRSTHSVSQRPPFVGREAELAVLMEAYRRIRGGATAAVVVEGESGVGKTALVRRFVDDLAEQGAVVLTGRCYEREAVTYKAVDGVVDSMCHYLVHLPNDASAALVPRGAALLGQVFPVLRKVKAIAEAPSVRVVDPQEQRSRLFGAMRELIGGIADRSPLVVVVDDLQWADADSLALLSEVLRPPDAPPLLAIATLRSGVTPVAGVRDLQRLLAYCGHRIEVGRLPADQAKALATILLGYASARTTASAGQIAEEADGHPLFIDELVRHAALSEGGPALHVRLDDALRSRLEALPAAARRVLELVAVAGKPVPQEVVLRAAAVDPVEAARAFGLLRIDHLVQSTGSRASDTIGPYHDRVREAVTSGLAVEERAKCHRDLALAFEGTGHADAETLALHWGGAGDRERSSRYTELAAAEADAALAFDHAAELYRAALELGFGTTPGKLTLRIRLGQALANAGRGGEAAVAFIEAAAEAEQAEAIDLQRLAAEQYLRSGYIDEGLALVRRVLAAAGMKMPATPRRALISVLLRRAMIRLRGLGYKKRDVSEISPKALVWYDICRSLATDIGMVDTILGADFNSRSLLLALRMGEPVRLVTALGHEALYSSLGGGTSHKRTERLLSMANSLGKEIDQPEIRGWLLVMQGMRAYFAGQFAKAKAALTSSELVFRDQCTGRAYELDTSRIFLLFSHIYLGEIASVGKRAPQLVAEALDHGDRYAATNLRISILNAAWLLDDDVAVARHEIDEAMARWPAARFHVEHFFEMTARIQLGLYSGEGASTHAYAMERWPKLLGSLLLRVQLAHLEALQLRGRSALAAAEEGHADRERLLREAERDAKKILRRRMPWSNPMGELILAGVHHLRGDDDRAVERLRSAITGFDTSEMALYANVSRRRLGELLGGDEGRSLVQTADGFMDEQRIRSPQRFAAMLAPGFMERG